MALMINETCTACDACEPVCPNDAIAVGDPFYTIDAFKCTECVGHHDEEQCAAVCPVDCCVPDPNIPEVEEALIGRARQVHPEMTFPDDFPSRFKT